MGVCVWLVILSEQMVKEVVKLTIIGLYYYDPRGDQQPQNLGYRWQRIQ